VATSPPTASPTVPATAGAAARAPAAKRPSPAPAPGPTPSQAPVPATAGNPAVANTAAGAAPAGSGAAPTLDLASLEARLRDTHAIGVFTKLSLKNQVDDLLAQFRAFYAGQGGLTLMELRHSYELLLMKVVTLLQDADPGLASAIATSREAIWAILSDRNRFNSL